jgi:hypothetical protein
MEAAGYSETLVSYRNIRSHNLELDLELKPNVLQIS